MARNIPHKGHLYKTDKQNLADTLITWQIFSSYVHYLSQFYHVPYKSYSAYRALFVFFFDNGLCLSGGPDDEDEHGEQDEEAAGQVVRSPATLVLEERKFE